MRVTSTALSRVRGALTRVLAPAAVAVALALAAAAFTGSHAARAAALPVDRLQRAVQTASPSIVLITYSVTAYLNDNRDGATHGPYTQAWMGTGFFISSDGYIATAAHVAAPTDEQVKDVLVEQYLQEDARAIGCDERGDCKALEDRYRQGYQLATSLSGPQASIRAFTQDMSAVSQDTVGLPAELKASSPLGQRDIAVIKVNGQNEPVLPVGDSSKVQVGDALSIIGYPGPGFLGGTTDLVPTATRGTVTALKQGSQALGLAPGVNVLQTDATVEQGNSGGPAVDQDGEVVGLVSFGAASTTNFLMTSSDIRDVVKQAGASNTEGQIDADWRDGLAFFDQHRYRKAMNDFDQCVTLNKAQVGCAQMATTATSLLGRDEEWKYAPKTTVGLVPVLGTGALAATLALAAFLVAFSVSGRRRRGAAPPSAHDNFCVNCGARMSDGHPTCQSCGAASR